MTIARNLTVYIKIAKVLKSVISKIPEEEPILIQKGIVIVVMKTN